MKASTIILVAGICYAGYKYDLIPVHFQPDRQGPQQQAVQTSTVDPSVVANRNPPAREDETPPSSSSSDQGSGSVIKILPDDNDGSRHQRFIVQLSSGQTRLIAHNIDIAPRVSPLSVGDSVEFCGEYASNAKGGVIHWTHHDPSGRHPGGWIKCNGRVFN